MISSNCKSVIFIIIIKHNNVSKDHGGNEKDVTTKQGLRQNLSQFVILIMVNALVAQWSNENIKPYTLKGAF